MGGALGEFLVVSPPGRDAEKMKKTPEMEWKKGRGEKIREFVLWTRKNWTVNFDLIWESQNS